MTTTAIPSSSVPPTLVQEDYPLPGAYRVTTAKWTNGTDTVGPSLPLAIISSVMLFPNNPDAIKRRRGRHGSLPGAWVSEEECRSNDVDELRRTVAALRKETQELEEADVMVKKGLEIVAHKRVLAQHKRRRQSDWDWCESSESDESEHERDWEWVE